MQEHDERDDQDAADTDETAMEERAPDAESEAPTGAGTQAGAENESGTAEDADADQDEMSDDGEAADDNAESPEGGVDVADVADEDAAVSEAGEDGEPLPEIEIPELKQILEGAILAADKPLSIDNMISLFAEGEQPSRKQVRAVLEEIESDFEDRGFELKQVASGYRFQVRERYGDWIGRLWEEKPPRYTRALLETLALIAYKQPITRGDVEEIRGVAVSTNIIRTLLEREWIRVVGHRDVPGKPAIYATTKTFLDYFNLSSLDELPTLSEIKDLGGANEELPLDEEIIAPRSLELDSGEGADDAEAAQDAQEDADLDEVTNQVNTIQENIKNLFAEPEPEPDLDDLDDTPADVDAHTASDDTVEGQAAEANEPDAGAEPEEAIASDASDPEEADTESGAEDDDAEDGNDDHDNDDDTDEADDVRPSSPDV